jgi:hypothetical protein
MLGEMKSYVNVKTYGIGCDCGRYNELWEIPGIVGSTENVEETKDHGKL